MVEKNLFSIGICMLVMACNGTSMTAGGKTSSPPPPSTPAAAANSTSTTNSAVATPAPTIPSATVTAAPAATSNSTPDPNSSTPLTGLWDAKGYTCDGGAPPIEVISITQTSTQFVGTKVTGDPCVPAGYISFQGSISAGVLSLRFNEGEPGHSVQLGSQLIPGSYTPTLVQINGNGYTAPPLTLTPHQN